MKKCLIISILALLSFQITAQKKKPSKSTKKSTVVAIDSTELLNRNQIKNGLQQVQDLVEANLTGKDLTATQNGLKTYYDSYKILLHAGEELDIEHSSNSFRVMLALKKPVKTEQTEFSYDSKPFSGNSFNKFHFVAPSTGIYTLLATSMDAQKTGKYVIKKTISTSKALEADLDPVFSQKFKEISNYKKSNFKDILGEKVKKDKKDKIIGQDKYTSKFELVAGKPGQIMLENGGQIANFKSIIFESATENEAQAYFDKIKKQLQVLTRSWVEQPSTDKTFSASTDQDIVSLNMSALEDKKKKKTLWQVNFIYN